MTRGVCIQRESASRGSAYGGSTSREGSEYGQQAGGTHPTGMYSCYRPQTKFAKVMFLHLSVILFTGGGLGLCAGGSLRSLSRGVSILGGLCPRGVFVPGVSVWGGLCPRGSPPGLDGLCPGGLCHGDPPRTATSGRYASYWNAFLFLEYAYLGVETC